MSDVVKKFLVLEKEYADECQHLDFWISIKQATAVSSNNPRFDHEDAAEHMAESLATDGSTR